MIQPNNKNQTRSIIIAILCCFPIVLIGQQDFNNFKTLVSEGPIPADFTSRTSEKIAQEIESNRVKLSSTVTTKKYLEAIHTSIDDMLLSGYVVYGDEISEYVKSIAENLLKGTPELQGKFRYYTIKSNETNALSTDQGIIFVTTGLISQLSSEAQLAYVLAHEISHYTEHHVLSGYEERLKTVNKRNRIEKMSTYSKELEFTADRLALKLFHDAGYSVDEIIPTFDVLMYSYLPFDDVVFRRDYFNSELAYVPEVEFGTKTYPIKTNENYDDDNSSHPNIRKRKDAINEALRLYDDWGTTVNNFGDERFTYVRQVARFESLRSNIIDAELCQALYSIYLLEAEFPNSIYLKHMKALTWLSMLQLNAEGDFTRTIPSQSDYEGESSTLYYFIKNLKSKELAALGLREIYDLKSENPDDSYLNLVYERVVKSVSKTSSFVIKEFNIKSMKERVEELKTLNDIMSIPDTNTQVNKSKYDKIKTKTDINAAKTVDSTNFAMYMIPDIIQDQGFLKLYNQYKKEQDSIQAEKDAFSKLSKADRKKAIRDERSGSKGVNLEKFVLVEPSVTFSNANKYTLAELEVIQDEFVEAIENSAEEVAVTTSTVSRGTLETGDTKLYNERNAYFSFLNQASNYPSIDIFPVDYERLKEFTADRGTSTILFTTAEYTFAPELRPIIYIYSAVMFPTLPFTLLLYTPIKILKGRTTEYSTIVFDTQKGSVLTYGNNTVHSKAKPSINRAYYYHLLKKLKQPSK